MAIKERKQITGTATQIKGFAGHNGVLAYATDTKHLHVLSGTAGTTTELANRADIPDITGKADKTYVDTELAKKQAKGDYATTKALSDGLAGKANTAHTHNIANVTGLQEAINSASTQASNAIPKAGNRGALAGYATSTSGATVDASAKDSQYTGSAVTVSNGATGQTWTKIIKMSGGTVTLGSNWTLVDGEAPELTFPCILICHWNEDKGIAGIVKGAS